ncbi:hypothetical protein L596_026637 [Steinernema carpocapsae]|uniref:Uncharacterized protein n=1 Tax=Steinernema carpocapsae TaxID=34508 RepID=A0A4U5M1Z2_STECR|nr:hypothetical protein L596_026637 [Steinernema carpocapsae]
MSFPNHLLALHPLISQAYSDPTTGVNNKIGSRKRMSPMKYSVYKKMGRREWDEKREKQCYVLLSKKEVEKRPKTSCFLVF